MSAKKKTVDPVALARDAVQEVFDTLVRSPYALESGFGEHADLDLASVFDEIEQCVFREDAIAVRNGDYDAAAMRWRLAGREAGYLVGVQVGLRLRGGVR